MVALGAVQYLPVRYFGGDGYSLAGTASAAQFPFFRDWIVRGPAKWSGVAVMSGKFTIPKAHNSVPFPPGAVRRNGRVQFFSFLMSVAGFRTWERSTLHLQAMSSRVMPHECRDVGLTIR